VVKDDPKAGNEIRALTGATISSESVAEIVNAALANVQDAIGEREDAGVGADSKE